MYTPAKEAEERIQETFTQAGLIQKKVTPTRLTSLSTNSSVTTQE